MKKIALKNTTYIQGWGEIQKGTQFRVERYNQRFVYVRLSSGVSLRLARKADCEVIY